MKQPNKAVCAELIGHCWSSYLVKGDFFTREHRKCKHCNVIQIKTVTWKEQNDR